MPRARIDPETGLTEKQERFSLAYMENGGNATQAYLSSYNAKKAKPETVNNKAMVLLHKGEIGARIAALRNAAAKRAEVREADVLCETGHIAFSDLRKLFNENGTVKQPHEWPQEIAAAVASFEVFEEYQGRGENRKFIGYTKRIRLWDKNSALEKLMKHLGMFEMGSSQTCISIAKTFIVVPPENRTLRLTTPENRAISGSG